MQCLVTGNISCFMFSMKKGPLNRSVTCSCVRRQQVKRVYFISLSGLVKSIMRLISTVVVELLET